MQYFFNLLILITLWTTSSFAAYFIVNENSYIAQSLFAFCYFEGLTGVAASLLAQLLYECCQMRRSFLVAIAFVLLGATCLLVVQMRWIPSESLEAFRLEHNSNSKQIHTDD